MLIDNGSMEPYIVSAHDGDITIAADSQAAAEKFAKNYFGDRATDYRNKYTVTFTRTVDFGLDTFYVFRVN